MTKKEEYTASAVEKKTSGTCCTPGKYKDAESICDITPTDAMKKSSAWKQPEMALANCPNLTAYCGSDTPLIDLDATSGAITRIAGND